MQLGKRWAKALDDYVIDLAWSPDCATLAAASAAGPIALLGAEDGASTGELPGHDGGTNAIAWQPGGPSVLASGGQDGAVKLWDAAAAEHIGSAKLGAGWVEHLGWRPAAAEGGPRQLAAIAGRQLAFLNPDATIRHRCPDAPKTLSALAWHPQGGCIATAHFGGVRLWDTDDFIVQKEFPYANGIQALVWSPDGRWLVSGNQDPSVHLWVPEEDLELQMSGYEGKVRHLAFDHSSRWLATAGGAAACIWDCAGAGPEGREPAMLPHDAPVCALAFQPQHGLLATAAADGSVMLWSPERKQPLRATLRLPRPATQLAWSGDDRHLAIGSEQGLVYVLRLEG
jgi:WD40 repeat protein